MTVLYVDSDQPGAGKTAFCATLAHLLQEKGKSVAVFKPLTSGGEMDTDADIYGHLLGQPGGDWPRPLSGDGLTPEVVDEITSAFADISADKEITLVEAPTGLSSSDARQLVDGLDAAVVAVVRYRSGLQASDLTSWRETFGDRLAGFVFNGRQRYLGTEARVGLLASLETEGLKSFGVIPEDRRLLGVTVRQLAEHLGGRLVDGEESGDRLVEHFMVGGWTMDPGELYFGLRENKAVIVRGDRPDMQMAALPTPTACMVLTNGIEPIEYVKNEAELEEVPVLVVDSDTLTTMDSLNTVQERARFDHPLKLQRFAELVQSNLDTAGLYAAVGMQD